MKPTPMPAPIEPRPAPTPRAIALPSPCTSSPVMASVAATTGARSIRESAPFLSSVTGGGGSADVDSAEGRGDECLQGCHQTDLEDEEDEGEREGDRAECRDPQEDGEPAAHEEQQQVAGEDVGEKSDGQADQADEVRDDLDHEDRAAADRAHVLEARGQPALQV